MGLVTRIAPPLFALVLLCDASLAFASHSNDRFDINRSDLDDDIVETFPIPVLFGVSYGNVVPDFGDARGGGTRSHEGQDFRAPLGTPIVSPTEAIVIRTGTGESAGKYVYTANPGGETFRYMHLDTIANIKRGDELDPGDLIGTVGDTGNAPEGIYHLHFEVRDEDNKATDPYPRLDEEGFTLKQKMSFMRDILRKVDGDADEYAEFLVSTFRSDFLAAAQAGYALPDEIDDALEDAGVGDAVELLEKLNELIDSIPAIIPTELEVGDQGTAVSLLQTYLIFRGEGPATDRLVAAGATGYYGSITAEAVLEYQGRNDLAETGVFDRETKVEMAK